MPSALRLRSRADTMPRVTVGRPPRLRALPIGDDLLADLQAGGRPELGGHQIGLALDLDQRDVRLREGADEASRCPLATEEPDLDVVEPGDHMGVGQHEPVGGEHDARAGTGLAVEQGAAGLDRDDRRFDGGQHGTDVDAPGGRRHRRLLAGRLDLPATAGRPQGGDAEDEQRDDGAHQTADERGPADGAVAVARVGRRVEAGPRPRCVECGQRVPGRGRRGDGGAVTRGLVRAHGTSLAALGADATSRGRPIPNYRC